MSLDQKSYNLPRPGSYEYKIQEAYWKKNISATHRFFCACPNWLLHFKWPGFHVRDGSAEGTGPTRVVRGPLDGAIISSPGSHAGDTQEAVAAAVSFLVDDTE